MLNVRSKPDIENQLIRAIRESDMTPCRIAKLAGVNRAALCRLLSAKRSLTLPSAAKLCRVLGLELRKVEK